MSSHKYRDTNVFVCVYIRACVRQWVIWAQRCVSWMAGQLTWRANPVEQQEWQSNNPHGRRHYLVVRCFLRLFHFYKSSCFSSALCHRCCHVKTWVMCLRVVISVFCVCFFGFVCCLERKVYLVLHMLSKRCEPRTQCWHTITTHCDFTVKFSLNSWKTDFLHIQ